MLIMHMMQKDKYYNAGSFFWKELREVVRIVL